MAIKSSATRGLEIRPHLRAHIVSQREVALLGEGVAMEFRGEVLVALVPLLDGTRSEDELVEVLREGFPAEVTYYALMMLKSEDVIAPAVVAGDATERAWWSAHRGSAASGAPPRCSVALVDAGAHPAALAALVATLGRRHSLVEVSEQTDVVVIASDDYLNERLEATAREALTRARWVLPVRTAGPMLWAGPLLAANTLDRLGALLARLRVNRSLEQSVRRSGAEFPLVPSQGLPETFDLLANWIVSALPAIAINEPPPALLDGVVTLDPWNLESTRHRIVMPVSEPHATESHSSRVILESAPKRFVADGGHRVCTPQETLSRLNPFVGPITGLLSAITRVATPEALCVYSGTQAINAPVVDFRANRILGRTLSASGKGASDIQARVSCLAEAIERYSCSMFADVPRRQAKLAELGADAVAPHELLLFSDQQYRNRESTNAIRPSGFNWVPMPFDSGRSIDWTPAWSLTHQRQCWLPTTFCYLTYPPDPGHDFCCPDSNGCASGNTIEEAILQGFFELVERDACALWWYSRVRRPEIDLASAADPFIDRTRNFYRDSGREMMAIDITTDLEIPTVVAMSWRRADRGRIHFGLGCHLSPRLALSRAVAELNQSMANEVADTRPGRTWKPSDPDHARWLTEVKLDDQPYLKPLPGRLQRIVDFQDRSTPDLRDDVALCLDLLATRDLEMIVLKHTRPDIGFPVVRVVVPGLRHFWQRLAPGRLYDAPVSLGWLEQPLTENELNPIPVFI